MKKRMFLLVLAFVLILCLPLSACATETPMPEGDWETCVIQERNCAIGTMFYEVHSDGTVDIYSSIAIDSMDAYLYHLDPDLSLKKHISLTPEQFAEFLGLLNAIRKDGRLVPPPEPDESERFVVDDGREIGYYLDGKELGLWNLAEYEDYPPEEYIAPWMFFWKLSLEKTDHK